MRPNISRMRRKSCFSTGSGIRDREFYTVFPAATRVDFVRIRQADNAERERLSVRTLHDSAASNKVRVNHMWHLTYKVLTAVFSAGLFLVPAFADSPAPRAP